MTEDLNTKDLSDRELLELMRGDLRSVLERVMVLDERVAVLEARTNPLPPNYDARFAALESDVHEIRLDLRQLRERDWQRGRQVAELEQRVDKLEGYQNV